MKRTRIYESICIIIIIIVICKTVLGQWGDLEVRTYSGTYTDIEDPQHIYFHPNLALHSNIIPVDFKFQFSNDKFAQDSIRINYDGFVTLSESTDGDEEMIYAFGADFIDRYAGTGELRSSASYTVVGNRGNRILKIQWKNMGFQKEYDLFGTTDSYTNVQLWLYEAHSFYEVRVGPTYSPYNAPPQPIFEHGPMVGYYAVYWDQYQNPSLVKQLLSGDPSNPVINGNWYLNTFPAEGTVYQFRQATVITNVGEEKVSKNKMNVFPNPTSGMTTIEYTVSQTGKINLSIYDLTGRRVDVPADGVQTEGKYQVRYNATHLPPGYYLAVLTNGKTMEKTRILVTR